MRQFDIYKNPDRVSARRRPYLVVLQSDFLDVVNTVVVAPLAPLSRTKPIARLTPSVMLDGTEYVLLVQDMAAVRRSALKQPAGTAAAKRHEIVSALDLVFQGF